MSNKDFDFNQICTPIIICFVVRSFVSRHLRPLLHLHGHRCCALLLPLELLVGLQ